MATRRPSEDSSGSYDRSGRGSDSSAVSTDTDSDDVQSPTARPPQQETLTNVQLMLERFASTIGQEEDEGDTAASSAERHRLANSVGLDLPLVATWIEKAAPFLLLLGFIFVYWHIQGIFMFLWLNAILAKANDVTRQQAALKQDRSRQRCLSLATLMPVHIGLVLLLLRKQQLWMNFLLISTAAVPTVWDVMYRVSIADVLVRFWGISLKSTVLATHSVGSRAELRQRSQVLTVLEHAIHFYRNLLATPVWYEYFVGSGSTSRGMLANSAAIIFIALKMSLVWERGQQLVVSAQALAQAGQYYGKAVSAAELCELGHECSICQETLRSPVRLSCQHVYCDVCISEWFERERTCPMCRAVVQPPGFNAHSDASTPLLPCLF